MTKTETMYVMRTAIGTYIKMQTIRCAVGFSYSFSETNNLADAETLRYAKTLALPRRAQTLLEAQYKDITFVPVTVTNTIQLK